MAEFTKGQRVKIKAGQLPCSPSRPFCGKLGTVKTVFPELSYNVAVDVDGESTITYHAEELEAVS